MVTKQQNIELGRLRRDLRILRDRWVWPCDPGAVADLCTRAFASLDALAHDYNTPLGVCFRPGGAKDDPAATCCRALKALSDLHAAAIGECASGEQGALSALKTLETALASLEAGLEKKKPAKAAAGAKT
jgi:hypothetical protein